MKKYFVLTYLNIKYLHYDYSYVKLCLLLYTKPRIEHREMME